MKKKEKEYRKRKEEEEDARPLVWIKYTLGLKHQVNKISIADPKAWRRLMFTFIACLDFKPCSLSMWSEIFLF